MYLLNNFDSESCTLDTALKYLEAKGLDTEENIADAIFYWSEGIRHNIKAVFLFAQHLLETANGTSFWYKHHNNYAGIGVDGAWSKVPLNGYYFDIAQNKYFKGIHFDSKLKGLEAHVAHIDAYVFDTPRFNAEKIDSRFSVVRAELAERKLKYADTFEVLAPIYATDKDYYKKVMAKYQSIMAFRP